MTKVDIVMGEGTIALGYGVTTNKSKPVGHFICFRELINDMIVGDCAMDAPKGNTIIRLNVKGPHELRNMRNSLNELMDKIEEDMTNNENEGSKE